MEKVYFDTSNVHVNNPHKDFVPFSKIIHFKPRVSLNWMTYGIALISFLLLYNACSFISDSQNCDFFKPTPYIKRLYHLQVLHNLLQIAGIGIGHSPCYSAQIVY